jgi:hypothetical protein
MSCFLSVSTKHPAPRNTSEAALMAPSELSWCVWLNVQVNELQVTNKELAGKVMKYEEALKQIPVLVNQRRWDAHHVIYTCCAYYTPVVHNLHHLCITHNICA